MLRIKEYKDFGAGMCVVLIGLNEKEIRLNKENLEIRIKNLKAQDLNVDVEEKALIKLNGLSSVKGGKN